MARRHIHYEAAFEDYLRSCGLPYIAVDEHRKAIFAGGRVKSFDFVVYRPDGPTWLVDIKGRKFPYENDQGHKRYWENWITRDDLDGLSCWQKAFGDGFESILVFAYLLMGPEDRAPTHHVHPFRDQHYAFMCVRLDDYRDSARTRSPKWDTLSLPTRTFRDHAKPIQLT